MTRDPADLVSVLHSSYTLPTGAWLLTGTSLVPPEPYTASPGDVVRIAIDGLGELVNHVSLVRHSGAEALPTRLAKRSVGRGERAATKNG
jgi:fumarylacetoacetate (FAA) hydrolase family protein